MLPTKDRRHGTAKYYIGILSPARGGSKSVYFEGEPTQLGYGLLDNIVQGVVSAGKTLGRLMVPAAVKATQGLAEDLLEGKPVGRSLKSRGLEFGRRTATTALRKVVAKRNRAQQPARGQGKRRKKKPTGRQKARQNLKRKKKKRTKKKKASTTRKQKTKRRKAPAKKRKKKQNKRKTQRVSPPKMRRRLPPFFRD